MRAPEIKMVYSMNAPAFFIKTDILAMYVFIYTSAYRSASTKTPIKYKCKWLAIITNSILHV